ncbi:ASKHA domain-containing protein [soil metagenome]
MDESASRHRVVFTPSGLSDDVVTGTTVLDAARRLGVDLDSVCGGRGICGRCQVTPSVGSFAKWQLTSDVHALSEPGDVEQKYHGSRPLAVGNRLGCAAAIVGDVVVDVPASSQVHRQIVRKDLDMGAVVVDPLVALLYVELATAELGDDVASVADQVLDALGDQHGVIATLVAPVVLRSAQRCLARGEGTITVAVRDERVVAVWAGFFDGAVGVAVDVGSTTIAGHLCDLSSGEVLASAGRMNPQIRFGEDLMSRVSYVMMNPGGDQHLTAAVRSALDELVGELAEMADCDRAAILEVVIVGNPIMHHLVLGIDPTPLGQAPFVLATDRPVTGPAADLGIDAPFASFYVGPCIAGHVGADTAAAVLAEGPHRGERMQLLVDVGTNAEIVLGDRERQFAASSPTGPAFEGAQISCGQRATTGAIERVAIDPITLEARVKVIGSDAWSDEAGFAATVACSGVTGVCGSGIIDAVAEMYLAGVIDPDGTILGANAARSPRVVADGRTFRYVLYAAGDVELSITQNDVRAIQLAKAALRAGIDLLVERAGSPAVDDIRLAGAFGAHIDPLPALVLGFVPDCALSGARAFGNAAGAGAVQALLSREKRTEMETAVREVVKVETATEPRFQELFVAAMAFPHATAPSPQLAQLVTLPERVAPIAGRRRR